MKKNVIIGAMALALAACSQKQAVPTAEENAEALAAYASLEENLNKTFEDETLTEEEVEAAFGQFLDETKALLRANKGGELVYVALPELYYYLTTEEKEEFFADVCPDSVQNGKLARQYTAFEAEKKTCVGCIYTDFEAETPEGEMLKVSELVGQTDYVLIDFWASWCGPCRASMPALKEVYAKHHDRLEVLGVSLDQDRERWLKCRADMELNWKHVSDLQGWQCAPAALYGVCSIPATVLIDKNGTIVARNIEAAQLEELLAF